MPENLMAYCAVADDSDETVDSEISAHSEHSADETEHVQSTKGPRGAVGFTLLQSIPWLFGY